MSRLKYFAIAFALCIFGSMYAQAVTCNSASGFVKLFGNITVGNLLQMGADCQTAIDGGTYPTPPTPTVDTFGTRELQLVEQQPANTGTSQTATNGSFQNVFFNTLMYNDITGITRSGTALNGVPAATYRIIAQIPFAVASAGDCVLRLRDTTNNVTLINTSSMTTSRVSNTICTLTGRFTVASGPINIQLQLFFDAGTYSISSMNSGEQNYFAIMNIWKISGN